MVHCLRFGEGIDENEGLTAFCADCRDIERCIRCHGPIESEEKFAVFCDGCRPPLDIEGRGGGLAPRRSGMSGQIADQKKRLLERLGRRGGGGGSSGSTSPQTVPPGTPAPDPPADFWPSPSEVEELFRLVVESDYVNQAGYRKIADTVRFDYVVGNREVVVNGVKRVGKVWQNATAGSEEIPDDQKVAGGPEWRPLIRLFEGYVRVCAEHALATPVGQFAVPGTLMEFVESRIRGLPRPPRAHPGPNATAVYDWQARLLSGMILSTIAHEMGHVCLGHNPRFDPASSGTWKKRVKQIHERQADGFAAAVVALSADREARLRGQLVKFLCNLYENEGDAPLGLEEPTHPGRFERLENAIRNNPKAAKELGIDLTWIKKLCGLN